MEQGPQHPLNTKEFAAGWQNIVEEHLAGDLSGALQKLVASRPGGAEALARHVTHALQMASGPTGSVQAAVQYLCQVADQPEGEGPQGG
jgi:hypothetical protein